MGFFKKQETRSYFSSISEKLKNEVKQMSDDNISTCDFSEWINYLYSKYEITPIKIFEESITQSISETKVKRYNHFARHSQYEPEYSEVDGCKICYTIPYDGDSELLFLRPSTFVMTRYDAHEHRVPSNDNVGNFKLIFEFTKQELESKGKEMKSFVNTQFENEFKHYRTMIEYVNQEVVSFNNQISSFAKKCLEERKEKASSFAMISQMLEIPLSKSKNAPSSTPIRTSISLADSSFGCTFVSITTLTLYSG